jgi:bis(5'-adenosyl)-triphosphatase
LIVKPSLGHFDAVWRLNLCISNLTEFALTYRMMKSYFFGPFALNPTQIFFETSLSLAIVNLKPIVPGHVLILPKRVEPRFLQLSIEEHNDLFHSVRVVSAAIERHYSATAMNVAIQDGKDAGQSVPHVHVHILPRKAGEYSISR